MSECRGFHLPAKEAGLKHRIVPRLIWIFIPAVFLLFTASGGADDRGLKFRTLLEQPTVKYETDFVVAVPLEVWNRVLAHPLLMAKLWNLYNFQPAYEVHAAHEGVLVVDPSGIRGQLIMTDCLPDRRSFYGRGSVDHWAIPSFISAEGVFRFRYAEEGPQIKGTFQAYLRGDNKTTDLLMKLTAGRLKNLLHRRFTNNLNDMKKIVADIARNPDQIRQRLSGESLREFNSIF